MQPHRRKTTVRSSIPGGSDYGLNAATYRSRVLSEGGKRVFFNSNDCLVPEDSNGTQDVYVYEDGKPHLISSGNRRW
ncbi:MAG TPA: hypothetical protein VID48_09370 [Solirubrobacteraceae bacterium]